MIIGASNVTRGLPSLIYLCQKHFNRPIEFLIAAGHGRSLGLSTQVLVRKLPSILECGLWEKLSSENNIPTYALVTDLGNDLAYNIAVPQILEWFNELLQRLHLAGSKIVFATPPLSEIQKLKRLQFNIIRSILFPTSKLKFENVIQFAQDLDAGAKKNLNFFSGAFVIPKSEWYGLDPIHILRWKLPIAWQEYVQLWPSSEVDNEPSCFQPEHVSGWKLEPEKRWLFRFPKNVAQPAVILSNGSTVSLF